MEKIHIEENPQGLNITVKGEIAPGKLTLLKIWLALWVICGSYVLYEFIFTSYSKEIKLVLFVYLIFWGYYLWRISKVLIYRLKGFEKFIIDENGFTYIFHDGRKSHTVSFAKDENIKFEYLSDKVGSFAGNISNSFWNISGKSIGVNRYGKWVEMGIQIPEEEAKNIIRKLNFYFKRIKS